MLKEQVAEKLFLMDNVPFDDLKEHATGFNEGNPTQAHYLRRAQAIINLFKSAVGKLAVVEEQELKVIAQGIPPYFPPRDWEALIANKMNGAVEAQLQHTKKQLYDLMGE